MALLGLFLEAYIIDIIFTGASAVDALVCATELGDRAAQPAWDKTS